MFFPKIVKMMKIRISGQALSQLSIRIWLGEIESRRIPLLVKRGLGIVGSLLALLFLAPPMILIAIGVKLNSPGPVLFRQTRL
jgi:lipopolysaccharide/colanic/teichoic acid biosynthesis glycosyltransferase